MLVEGGLRSPSIRQAFLEGHMTPVLWGSAPCATSASTSCWPAIGEWAPAPKVMKAQKAAPPEDPQRARAGGRCGGAGLDSEVTGFVFKVQANMDPNHRDRIAMFKHGLRQASSAA